MKLKIQRMDMPAGRHLVVTDENDVILPMIKSVEVKSDANEGLDVVVVTFLLDDDDVKLVGKEFLPATDIYDESGSLIGRA